MQNIQQLGATLGSVFINALKPVVKMLNLAMLQLNSFVKTIRDALGQIFGWTYEDSGTGGLANDFSSAADSADDIASSTGKAAKNAKKIQEGIRPFDKLNVINLNKDSEGSGSGSGNVPDAEAGMSGGKWKKGEGILKQYESEIKTLEQLGKHISESLTKAMNNIQWDKIYAKARNFGKGLASFLNGLISPGLFGALGKTISGSLNTALNFLNSFGKTFNWENFGLSIATGINKFFKTFDFKLLANTLNVWANGLLDTLITAVSNVKWGKVAKSIAKFISEIDTAGIGWRLGKLVNSLANAVYRLVANKSTWSSLGSKIAQGINSFFKTFKSRQIAKVFNSVITGALTTASTFLKETDFEEIGNKIGDFMEELDFSEMIKNLAKVLWEAIKSAFGAIKGLWDSAPLETGLLTAFAALKFSGIGKSVSSGIWSSLQTSLGALPWSKILAGIGIVAAIGGAIKSATKKAEESIQRESLGGKTIEEYKEYYDGLTQSIQERAEATQEYIDTAGLAEYNHAKDLATKYYELDQKQQKSNEDYSLMQQYAKDLVGIYPDLNEYIDKETGLFKVKEKRLRKLIEKQKEYYKVQAAQEKLKDLYSQQIDAESVVEENTKGYDKAFKEYEDADKEWKKKQEEYRAWGLEAPALLEEQIKGTKRAALDAATETLRKSVETYDNVQAQINKTYDIIEDGNKKIAEKAKKGGKKAGKANAEGSAESIEENADVVMEARNRLWRDPDGEISDYAFSQGENVGPSMGQGIAKGIEDSKDVVVNTSKDVIEETADSTSTHAETQFQNVGPSMGQGIAKGITNSKDTVKDAVDNVLDKSGSNAGKYGEGTAREFVDSFGNVFKQTEFKFNVGPADNQGIAKGYKPKTKVKKYAAGGFPEDGWFRASKGEYFGRFDDGTSYIANNNQIEAGMAAGIEQAAYRGFMKAISEAGGNNTNVNIKIEGDRDKIFKVTREEARNYTRRTGKPAFNF